MTKTNYDNAVIEQGNLKYEGKAKQVYLTNQPDILWIHYLDQATALNGKVKETIIGKGEINSKISHLLFTYLEKHGVAQHYLKTVSQTDELVQALQMIPIEVVSRNFAAGHFVSRFAVPNQMPLHPVVQEFYYKSDALDDPFINDSQILALGFASPDELAVLRQQAQIINDLLGQLFEQVGIRLVDFKLEFGRNTAGTIILADELSPDNMRLIDQQTGHSLDKDVFRQHTGDVTVGYREVLRRLEQVI